MIVPSHTNTVDNQLILTEQVSFVDIVLDFPVEDIAVQAC